MSRIKGKTLVEDLKLSSPGEISPYIKWLNKDKIFAVLVPDMYELTRNGKNSTQEIRIEEADLYRLINADRHEGFSFEAEQAELDDDTYLGISYVQYFYYLSKDVLVHAKREARKFHYPQKYFLKRRVPRGGRPVGSKIKYSEDELARLAEVYENRAAITLNCYKHDWADEYVELMKDICRYENKTVISRKQALRNFTVERRKWLEENS